MTTRTKTTRKPPTRLYADHAAERLGAEHVAAVRDNYALFERTFPAVQLGRAGRIFSHSFETILRNSEGFGDHVWDHVWEGATLRVTHPRADWWFPHWNGGRPPTQTFKAQVLHPYADEEAVCRCLDAPAVRAMLDSADLGLRFIDEARSWYYPGSTSTLFLGPRYDLHRLFGPPTDYVRGLYGTLIERQ